jgi:nitrous oxidase accessory protein
VILKPRFRLLWLHGPVALAVLMTAGASGALSRTLAERIAAAAPGAVLHLDKGAYAGPVVIDKPLTLDGAPGAVLRGGGKGSVVTLRAPDVTLRGLTITGSGTSLADEDAGVYVAPTAARALITNNRIEGNLFGVFLKGAPDAVVRANVIVGRDDLRMSERGNGVHLWNAPGSRVIGNTVTKGRDGIFTTTSRDNTFTGNTFRDLRFAIHYMYTNDATIQDNVSEGNHAGYVLMFSHRILMRGNLSRGDRDHGLLLNYANEVEVLDNRVLAGGEKCVFIYNAHKNLFKGNRFEGCGIGIHFTAGSEGNTVTANAFVGNRTQVKYVGTRDIEWASEGIGNYWSDNAAFDLDGDGIADRRYRPNGLVDQVLWRAPAAKLLLASPAIQVLTWVQSAFPAVLPGGVVDPAPLMRPPAARHPAGSDRS